MTSYLAVTAHYMIESHGRIVQMTNLIAFHPLKGKHSAKGLAEALIAVSDRAGLTANVCLCLRTLEVVWYLCTIY